MSEASTGKKSRAFIIGDKDHGLTIVITDPVMVAHYSLDDLDNPKINQMAGKEPIVAMAGVVKDLLPFLRGVPLDALEERVIQLRGGAHGAFSLTEEEGMLAELNQAATIGRIIRNNNTVCDVDFCLALTIDPAEIIVRGRSKGPAVEITDYLKKHASTAEGTSRTVPGDPQKFVISNLLTDDLDPLDAWTDPRASPKDS